MALYVNTNVSSINAQNQLVKSGNSLDQAFQRLSSGLRINSAADDAAGLQISNRLTSQVNGLNVATRNANDGISLAQTAEGSLQESTNILQRMRELALQSANGSNSSADRQALNKEIGALKSELTRISDNTAFGGSKILDGSFGTKEFQIGSEANETISLTLDDYDASNLGGVGAKGKTVTDAFDATVLGDAAETLTYAITDSDGNTNSFEVSIAAGDGSDALIEKVNAKANEFGVYAVDDGSGGVDLEASNSVTAITVDSDLGANSSYGDASSAPISLSIGAADSLASPKAGGVESIDVLSVENAQTAVGVIDQAIADIDSKRADLGAFQNRMQSTISNLSTISENVSAARSRVRDADFAAETAKLTQAQIIQQASTTILAQANQRPQAALSLLG
ncbi:flagellin [Idiomarina baltica]|uniref:Flagellin n=1 Tax=Idiomarina baltica OS145 TaxID=314276 RepID=A0ABM9WLL1_9GAMM|nr:flagellin [Idiomarina baltica]EAQ31837.1 Flagellin [Idiomarina baltica OS145]